MGSRTLLLVGCATLALAHCGTPTETPAGGTPTPTSAPSSAPATTSSGGATPAAGQNRNTGTPVDGAATVTAPPTASGGAFVDVAWTGPGNTGDYIDVAPRGQAQAGGEIIYVYTRDAMPVARLRMPATAGDYDIRYILDLGSERKVKGVAPISVIAATATLTAPPKAEGGAPLTVGWTGPSGEGDYVDIVADGRTTPDGEILYASTKDGNPARLTAPGKAGAYQVRYILEGASGRRILASSPLEVTQPAATLEAPESVVKGSPIKVGWTGPKRKGDYIDLVKKGQIEPSGELTYFQTDRETSNELAAPAEAGQYDIRYVLEAPGGRVVLATRSITVR